jgi:hypothetical protein
MPANPIKSTAHLHSIVENLKSLRHGVTWQTDVISMQKCDLGFPTSSFTEAVIIITDQELSDTTLVHQLFVDFKKAYDSLGRQFCMQMS